jgi:hypothetical protein
MLTGFCAITFLLLMIQGVSAGLYKQWIHELISIR